MTALAASMTFVACDNNDNEMGQLDNTPKSVSINLSNVISTRGAGQAIKDDSKVSLADLQVFFTNGTTLYKGKTVSGTEAVHYFSTKDDLNSWDRITVSYSPMKYVTDIKGTDDFNMTGFSLGYEKGFSIARSLPIFIETGANMQYAFKTFDNEDREDAGISSPHYYDMKATYSTLNLKVPVNLAYKLTFGDVSLIPYVGLNFKLNLLGQLKYSLEDPDDLEGSQYDDEDDFWNDIEDSDEDGMKQTLNMFEKKDVGGKDYVWKRFQMGWQIGVGLDYNNLHVGLGYTKDIMELCKKVKTSSVMVSLGYNF